MPSVPRPATNDGIDLDDVDRQLAQVREGGVAGAEVVDSEPDAKLAQPGQAVHDRPVNLDQHPLGHLQRER